MYGNIDFKFTNMLRAILSEHKTVLILDVMLEFAFLSAGVHPEREAGSV